MPAPSESRVGVSRPRCPSWAGRAVLRYSSAMTTSTAVPPDRGLRPLFPEDVDQGDPYVLDAGSAPGARYRYYVYTTGEEPVAGTAFPVYASDDLVAWRRLSDALAVEAATAHWAPSVSFIP